MASSSRSFSRPPRALPTAMTYRGGRQVHKAVCPPPEPSFSRAHQEDSQHLLPTPTFPRRNALLCALLLQRRMERGSLLWSRKRCDACHSHCVRIPLLSESHPESRPISCRPGDFIGFLRVKDTHWFWMNCQCFPKTFGLSASPEF